MKLSDLAAPFDPGDIHWRAQSVSKDGARAMALAYIDARDVMARLDAVCGPENWQDMYTETPSGRVICTISILTNSYVDGSAQWVAKSDGAGSTDIEGDKGGISDAFKRAAVKWGIGRYLYDMPTPWAACEAWEKEDRGQKRWVWSGWKPEGLRTLDRVARGNSPAAIDDPSANAATILTLAKAADVSIQVICETYKVSELGELSAAQAEAVKKRLNLTIKEQQKEAA